MAARDINANHYTNQLLIFPDGKLPCAKYNRYLLQGQHCDCQRASDFVHTDNHPDTSLVNILRELAGAQTSIDLCMLLLSIEVVADLLIELNRLQRVSIRVVTDANRWGNNARWDQFVKLKQEPGIEFVECHKSEKEFTPLMHHKFVIIDKKLCFLGSLNWTVQAVAKNNESVIKTNDPMIVVPLLAEFEKLWREFSTQVTLTDQPGEMFQC